MAGHDVVLAVAIPAAWLQRNVVSEGGYAALAQKAAGIRRCSPPGGRTDQPRDGAHRRPQRGRQPADSAQVHGRRRIHRRPAFPVLFAQANRAAHRWLFIDRRGPDGSWVVDVAPMLKEASMQRILSSHNAKVPATLTVPLTASVPRAAAGTAEPVATWGPWVSIGAVALSAVCAVLTLAAARRRGKALTSLGVSALLVGAGGWAGIEIAGRYVNDALNRTTGDIRRIAEVMVGHAEASLHQWLNLTLLAGAALVIGGVVVAMLGSLGKKPDG